MTCYLTSRDGRFAAAVAGGVVSDLTSLAGTSDAGHFLSEYELGGQPWVNGVSYEETSPLSAVDRVTYADADSARRRGRTVPGRAGRAVVHSTSRAGRTDAPRALPRWLAPVHSRRQAVTSDRLQPAGGGLGGTVRGRRGAERAAASTARTGSGGWPNSPTARRAGRLARHPASARRRGRRDGRRGVRRAQQRHRRDRDDRLGLPDRVDLARCGRRPWSCNSSTRACSSWTPRSPRCCRSSGSPTRTSTKSVTVRHLLTHTSGIDGDVFTDTGRGDDCLEKYVGLLSEQTQNHPLGATWSYCNAGFSVAGRVIEKVTGVYLGRRAAGAPVHTARPGSHRDAARGGAAVPGRGRPRGRAARRAGRSRRSGSCPAHSARPA